jgi:Mg-chelatase subunit ChlD
VFVLDVSRSMGWNGRLETAQTELKQVLAHLPVTTKFNLVTYSDTAAAWNDALVPATVENVRRAARFVDRLRPVNATNIWDGLRVAMADEAVDTVFFLSDGSPTAGDVDPDAILAELEAMNRWRRVRFHTIALTAARRPRCSRAARTRRRGVVHGAAREVYRRTFREVKRVAR